MKAEGERLNALSLPPLVPLPCPPAGEIPNNRLLLIQLDGDRRRIELDHPIKSLGEHAVSVRLHPEVHAEVRVSVVPE